MGIEKTSALILRSVDFSETSKVLTLFTREFGKLGVLAKGGRRLKGPFEAALDLLAVCSICVLRKPSAELDLLTEATLLESFDGLRHDLSALYGAYYVAEVLDGLTEKGDPHPALFDATLAVIRRLAEGVDRVRVLGSYQLVLLRELGYAPNLETCTACGGECPLASRMWLAASTGGLLCGECAPGRPGTQEVQGGTVRAMQLLVTGDETSVQRLALGDRAAGEIWKATCAAVQHHLGRMPRMAGWLEGSGAHG